MTHLSTNLVHTMHAVHGRVDSRRFSTKAVRQPYRAQRAFCAQLSTNRVLN